MLAGTQRVPHYSLISSPQHAHHHYHCSSLLFLFLWAAVAVAVAANPQLQPHPLARAPHPPYFPPSPLGLDSATGRATIFPPKSSPAFCLFVSFMH